MGLRCISTIQTEDGRFRARVLRDSEWNEYRVKFYRDGVYIGEGSDHHTDDKTDAMGTAHVMIEALAKKG